MEKEIPKRLEMKPNDQSFYQLTKTELEEFDEAIWLRKIDNILRNNKKVGIGDNTFAELEKNQIKHMLLCFNDTRYPVIFAWDPIQELTEEEIEKIIQENHNGTIGHLGIQKIYQRIKERCKIQNLISRIEDLIQNCDVCQKEKLVRIRPKEEPVISDTPLNPNDKIAMDTIRPTTKNKETNLSYQFTTN